MIFLFESKWHPVKCLCEIQCFPLASWYNSTIDTFAENILLIYINVAVLLL